MKNYIVRNIFIIVLSLLIVVRGESNNTEVTSGDFYGLWWDYNITTATLTITGNGGMVSVHPWGYYPKTPWSDYNYPVRFVVIGEGVTSVGTWVFRSNRRLISVSLPSTITYIGESSFEGCYRLRSLTIPPNVTEIGPYAFAGCERLENITIPPGLTDLGMGAFSGCSKLYSAIIPSTLSTISYDTFKNCGNLVNLTLSEGVSTIMREAFRGCVNLTSVYFPVTVSFIEGGAFSKCSSLTSFEVSGSNWNYLSEDGVIFYRHDMNLVLYPAGKIGNYTVKSNVKTIEPYAFSGCDGLTYVDIQSNITVISDYAFEDCANLRYVNYVVPPQSIGNFAFLGCSSLEVAPIVDGITDIGIQAFSGCTSLKSVTIPPSVTSLSYSSFFACSGLETAVVSPGTDTIPSNCFEECSSLKSVVFSDNIFSVSYRAFYGCSSLSNLVLPKNIKYISSESFAGCNSITSVVIPETIISISDGAFSYCNKLESFTVKGNESQYTTNEGVLFSGDHLLQYPCGKGDNYAIPNGTKVLNDNSFAGCAGLKSLVIPPSVTKVGDYCFAGSGLKSITVPPTVKNYGYFLFKECVDLESVTFESTDLKTIGISYFDGCSSLKYVSLPSSVKQLSSGCFKGCTSLKNLTLPPLVNYISSDAFEGCISLTYIKFEGKYDPCFDGYYYNPACLKTCQSLDIVCVPLDYANSTFCDRSICKTGHCEQEVSKYNQCYEVVKCGEPNASIRIRANATEWINKTDGCVEYVCDNITGPLSWSKCNNSKCIDGLCVSNDSVFLETDELEVEFTMKAPVQDWNVIEVTLVLDDVGGAETNKTGIEVNVYGEAVSFFATTKDNSSADLLTAIGSQCFLDPNTPVIYDDMFDEFNCTGFMQNIKRIRVIKGEARLTIEEEGLFLEEAHLNHANRLMLYIIISLITIAAYVI